MISYGYKLREDVREKGCARAQHDASDEAGGDTLGTSQNVGMTSGKDRGLTVQCGFVK